MQFSPCKEERYIAALRTHLQNKLVKFGKGANLLPRLRALTLYSIITKGQNLTATDIREFTQSVSGAALVLLIKKGYFVSTSIRGNSVKLIDRNVLSAVLLLLTCESARSGGNILIDITKNGVEIMAKNIFSLPKKTAETLKKCGATVLFEKKSGIVAAGLSAPDFSGKPTIVPSDIELLCDPLSQVKIFTFSLPDRYHL